MFTHLSADLPAHQHLTVAEARACELDPTETQQELLADAAVDRIDTAGLRRMGAPVARSWYDLPIASWAWREDGADLRT